MRSFGTIFHRWLADEKGAATIEFITVMPLAAAVFFASMESGVLSLRKTYLDRALEMTARELRLGLIANPTREDLKERICARMVLVNNCAANLTLELNVVASGGNTITIPSTSSQCVNRATGIDPALTYNPGVMNELVLVRACLVQDIVFPTSVLQVAVGNPADNEYKLISTTAFVNEPN